LAALLKKDKNQRMVPSPPRRLPWRHRRFGVEPVHSHPVHVWATWCTLCTRARNPTKKNPWAVAAPPARRLDYTAPMNLAAAAALPAVTPRSGVVLPRSGRRHCRRGVVPLAASSSVASFTSSSSSAAAALIYAPTPQDRPLRTPHSG